MAILFKDEMHDQFGNWPLAYIPYGGADFGELQAVALAIGDGDDAAFHAAWVHSADRFAADADAAKSSGRNTSARELYLRASCFYSASYHLLYGEPVDPKLVSAYRRQVWAFDAAMALSDPPVAPLRIPFEKTTLPAYLIPAPGRVNEVRPLLILTNGYDSSITDTYFAWAVAASRRGYHCLLFDGPGQGEMLITQNVRLRPDWETVVSAVVDAALAQSIVDPTRIALAGWSLGGYLAPRAASGEHRLAACIADPGQWGIAEGFRPFARQLGASAESATCLGELEQSIVERMWQFICNHRKLHWNIVRRGFWVNGVSDLRSFLCEAERYTMEGRAELIRCPTLFTMAENDPLASGTESFFDRLRCPKTLFRFAATEGVNGHCEMGNRSLFNRRVLDWLDETL